MECQGADHPDEKFVCISDIIKYPVLLVTCSWVAVYLVKNKYFQKYDGFRAEILGGERGFLGVE